MQGLDRGYADPRWVATARSRRREGTCARARREPPIMYVDFRQQRTAHDEPGQPIRDEEGRPKLEWVQRDRPLVKLHHVFNVEQTEGLKLRSLETAAPEWDGHERAEALINAWRRSGRPRCRRPGVLQPEGRPRGAAGPEPVRVAVGLHAHRAARAWARDRTPRPPEPGDPRRARRLRIGGLRSRGAAGRDRRYDDRRATRSGTSRGTAPRTSVPGLERWRTTERRSAPRLSMRSGCRIGCWRAIASGAAMRPNGARSGRPSTAAKRRSVSTRSGRRLGSETC